MIRQVRSLPRRSQASMPRPGSSPSRVSPVGRWSRVYFPDSQPPPSGLHGSRPMPASSAAGTTSHSISRTIRLYCGCRVTGSRRPERAGGVHGLRQLPPGEVGEAVVVDLPGPDEAVERAQRLLDRRVRVEGVDLVEVDRVDAEPAERGVEGAGQVARRQPAVVGPGAHREAALGGEDDLVGHVARVGRPATGR